MTPQAWLEKFRQENSGYRPDDRADALWPHVTQPDFVSHWLRACVADMASDPAILPPGFGGAALRSLVMLDDGALHLSVAMFDTGSWQKQRSLEQPDTVEFADGWTRLHFLRADEVEVQRLGRNPAPNSTEPERVHPGTEFILDNSCEALRFTAIGGECIVLRLLVRNPAQRHALEADAVTGAVRRIRQARSHEGRLQMTLSLLRSLGCRDAVDDVVQRVDEWPPELRWHAVCEMLALDACKGFALLDSMSRSDPDPALRGLALDTRIGLLLKHPELCSRD